MGLINMNCPGCGQPISLDESREFGFCNYCGTKVMVDKTIVEHRGSVKIDNSEMVEKFLANARRAKQKEDWEEVEKYYNLVEQNDPTNIEAIFYSSYGKAKTTLVDDGLYKRRAAFRVLQNCVSIVDDNFNMEKEEEQKRIIIQISRDILGMSGSTFTYKIKEGGFSEKNYTLELFANLNNEFCTTLEEIIKKYPDRDPRIPFYYELAILHKTTIITMISSNWGLSAIAPKSKDIQDDIQAYHEKWHDIDKSHVIPEPTQKTGGGCYVATCVYGSYDCPEVWTLRRYRDDTLASTWYGRAFIRAYYAISPTLVKWFGETKWFKKMWQGKLDRMVKRLNDEGVENTPYQDRNW